MHTTIMLLGALVPIMAASLFYVSDSRASRSTDQVQSSSDQAQSSSDSERD